MTTTAEPAAGPVRLLLAGAALASVSEQLFLVCLTLLVLDVAGPGPALGAVLAIAAVPRAVLLPLGGLLADRADPARVAAVTTVLRALLLGVLAVLVALGPPPLAVVAALSALLGVLDAAYYPASLALLPRVVPPAGLARANAVVQGAESAGDLVGPAVAAGLFALLGPGGGLGATTALLVVAAAVLTAVSRRVGRRPALDAAHGPSPRALAEAVRYAWREPVVRTVLLVLAVLDLAVVGPVLVGGAVLAEQRFGGPAALGALFTGFGAGSLVGLLAAGARPPRHRPAVLVAGTAVVGAGTAALGLSTVLGAAVGAAALIGVGEAFLGVVLVAWLQERVPAQLRGRVMSLVVLAVVAFDPVSYALAGALLPLGVTAVFTIGGGTVLLATALSLPLLSSRHRS